MPHAQAAQASPVPAQASPGPEELVPAHVLLVSGMITLAYLNSSLHVHIHSLMHVNSKHSTLHCKQRFNHNLSQIIHAGEPDHI